MTDPSDLLVVDDSALDRELVRRLLPPDCRVREAATAGEARARLAQAVPDLVLLDNRLPDADGVDLLPLFVERQIPVVMLTEVGSPEVIVVAMQRGAEDYLVKGSLTRDGLARTLATAFDKSALRRQLHQQHQALAEQAGTLEVRNREIRALAAALALAEQAERHRIAGLLHDDVQQLLFGARLQLQVLQSVEPAAQGEIVATVSRSLDQSMQSIRTLVAELSPPVPEDDLEASLRRLADVMSRLHRVAVHIEAEPAGRLASPDHGVVVTQVVRELVFNSVKHAGVEEVRIRLYVDGAFLKVTVEDQGSGFDPVEVEQRPARGFGLNSIRERLELIGGEFEIASHAGQGTCATITMPV